MSPTVAAPSSDGIGITSKSRPCTVRSSGTSDGRPSIMPSWPRLNHVERRRPGELPLGERQVRVAQHLERALQRGPGVLVGERQRRGLLLVVEQRPPPPE